MDFLKYSNIVLIGFLVWLIMAPRASSPRYGELFLAYMAALLFSLIASSEIMMFKPVAFFFTVGGVFAFFYVVFRTSLRVTIKNDTKK